MGSLNMGEFIYKIFNIFVIFFRTLYDFLSVSFTIPSVVISFINSIFPNLAVPTSISLIGLLAVTGIPVAIAIGIYYILKGPV